MPSINIPATDLVADSNIFGGNAAARTRRTQPIVYSGSLDQYKQADVTPVIGTEFEGLQVRDLLKAEDHVIRDLAVTSEFVAQTYSRHAKLSQLTNSKYSITQGCRVPQGARCHTNRDEGLYAEVDGPGRLCM